MSNLCAVSDALEKFLIRQKTFLVFGIKLNLIPVLSIMSLRHVKGMQVIVPAFWNLHTRG
jgi:hypothetical protein